MATAVWSGTVSFGLVSIPVKLFTATSSHNISFNLLHQDCKGRINLQNYCPQCERVVERSELIKGYEYEKGHYVTIDEEDIQKVQPESSSNLDIAQFIEVPEVDPIYYEKSYYLGPDKGSEKTFALLVKAMQETNRAAVGKLVMRSHEYLALIRPGMKGMVVHFMYFADEVKENEFGVGDFDLKPKEVQLAKQLVENLTEPFEPSKFEEEYVKRLEEMIDAKLKGRTLKIVPPKARPKETDLMEALQKSIQATKKPAARAEAAARPAKLKKAAR